MKIVVFKRRGKEWVNGCGLMHVLFFGSLALWDAGIYIYVYGVLCLSFLSFFFVFFFLNFFFVLFEM